jgi:hypothetical protein
MRNFWRWLIAGEGAQIRAMLGRDPIVPSAWYVPESLYHAHGNAALLFYTLIIVWGVWGVSLCR